MHVCMVMVVYVQLVCIKSAAVPLNTRAVRDSCAMATRATLQLFCMYIVDVLV